MGRASPLGAGHEIFVKRGFGGVGVTRDPKPCDAKREQAENIHGYKTQIEIIKALQMAPHQLAASADQLFGGKIREVEKEIGADRIPYADGDGSKKSRGDKKKVRKQAAGQALPGRKRHKQDSRHHT